MQKQFSRKNSKEKISSAQQAYDCALDLLSRRDYSEQKLCERLFQKGADEEQAQASIIKLREYGLLDERRYALRVYENWLGKRCYGRLHLQAELAKRGVRAEYLAEILELFTPELEQQQAENAAAVFLQRSRKKLTDNEADKQKIAAAACRFMAARGFSARYLHTLLKKLQSLQIDEDN